MRFSFTFAAVTALTTSVAYSQSVANLVAKFPSCAVACLASAATASNCDISDYNCQCGDASTAIVISAASCLATSCSDDDTDFTASLFGQICKAVDCYSSSSVIQPTGTITASETASMISTVTASISTVTASIPSVTATPVPSTSAGSAPSKSLTTSASSTPSTSPQPTSNAGSKLQAGAAVVGAVFFAAMAL